MAILATFNGVNASGFVAYWGYHFPCGVEVLVETKEAIEGVKRHPEFSHKPVRSKAAANDEATAEITKFDHDGDGKAGGSLPKAKRKAKAKKTAPAAESVA